MSLQQITTGDINTSATPTLAGLTVTSNITSSNVTVSGNLNVTGTPTFTNTISAPNTFGFKNRIINGGMVIDQRNAGAAVTINGANSYTVDRWFCGFISGGSFTMQQVADAPAGFGYSMKYTTVSTTTANDVAVFNQRVEASNVIDWNWGTSSGQTINASFWVKANNTGTYNASVVFYGGTSTYYYLIPYTVSSANTWTQISLQILPPPTAAGAYANALNSTYTIFTPFVISSSGWTTYGTANTWQTTSSNNYKASSAAFNLASTSSATFYLTGVQLEVGTQATSFDYRPYGIETMLCRRYYQQYTTSGQTYFSAGNVYSTTLVQLLWQGQGVPFRTIPSLSNSGTFTLLVGATTYTISPTAVINGNSDAYGVTNFQIQMSGTSLPTGSYGAILLNSAGAYLGLSAEL